MFAAWRVLHFGWRALGLPDDDRQPVVLACPSLSGVRAGKTVWEVCPSAQRAGVRAGMSMVEAQMRLPHLRWLNRDESAERQLQHRLLALAEEFTPCMESSGPGLVLLDLRSRLWRDSGSWLLRAQGMQQRARLLLGFDIEIGMAATPLLALLAARAASGLLILPARGPELDCFLQQLPLSWLVSDALLLERLRSWGLLRLGQVGALPRQQWVRRMGAQGMALHDLARGGGLRLLQLVVQQQRHCRQVDLPRPVETLPELMGYLQHPLLGLCDELAALWLLAGAVALKLKLINGSQRSWHWSLAEPGLDVELIQRLIEAGLHGVSSDAALQGFELELSAVARKDRQQDWLDQQSLHPASLAHCLDALEALLGVQRVGRPQCQLGSPPDQVGVQNYLQPAGPMAGSELSYGAVAGLPLQRLRPREPVQLQWNGCGRPLAMLRRRRLLPLRGCVGPWQLSGLWWDREAAWRLQYWDLQLEEGWICQVGGDGRQWWLEGIYG